MEFGRGKLGFKEDVLDSGLFLKPSQKVSSLFNGNVSYFQNSCVIKVLEIRKLEEQIEAGVQTCWNVCYIFYIGQLVQVLSAFKLINSKTK